MSVPVLSVRGVTKTFAATRALADFDLDVRSGEIHALVGENGSGKSTFIKILAGYHAPDDGGRITVDDEPVKPGSPESSYVAGCRFVHQDLGLVDELSVVDNLCLGGGFPTRLGTLRRAAARAQAVPLLDQLGLQVEPEDLVGDLNASARTGVAVARALRSDPEFPTRLLILDEPTSTMPSDEVEHLLAIIRRVASSGVGVLYVSHRLDEIFRLAERVTVLRDGRKVAMGQAGEFTHTTLVNALVGSEFDVVRAEVNRPRPDVGRSRFKVTGLRSMSINDFSVEFAPGRVTGIAGLTGSGRESVLGSIYGAARRDAGEVTVDGVPVVESSPRSSIRSGIAYLPPDRKSLGGLMDKSARENLVLLNLKPFWRRWRLRREPEVEEANTWFSQLSVRPSQGVERPLATFSGGNQQKILFARWLRLNPSVFLLDEPTQGVDINAKAVLHNQLLKVANDGGTVVVSSTDVDELAALCSRVVVMRAGRVAADLAAGNVTQAEIARACLGTDLED